METVRIEVERNATSNLPLIVVVRQKKEFLSWQIPLIVKSMYFNNSEYNKTSRTLCSTNYNHNGLKQEKEFMIISVSTTNHQNISFILNVTKEHNFYLRYIF